jgi:hypothetical protein
MFSNYLIVAALIAVFAAGWSARMFYEWYRGITTRLAKLEQAQIKHLPFETTDDLLDALANLNYIKFDREAEIERVECVRSLLFKTLNANKRK